MKYFSALCALVAMIAIQACASTAPGGSSSFNGRMMGGVGMRPAAPAPEPTSGPARMYQASAAEIVEEDAAVAAAVGKPADVSEDAKDLMAKGKAWVAQARGPEDFERAAVSMKKALALAPGWAAGYYNLALAEEGAGWWADGQRHLRYYLKLNPQAEDRERVRQKIAELSIREERGDMVPGSGSSGDDE